MNDQSQKPAIPALDKCPTGIQGFEEITAGGLPAGRPTLVCGAAGSGKTLFAMEFLVRGATMFDEPGVFVAFEETADELAKNVASLGFDLAQLERDNKLAVEHVYVDRSEIEETGEYDLEALFIRLNYAVDSVGARRVVLDTLEALFAALPNEFILRSELRRLFRWLKDKGVTAIITAEKGGGQLTRHGLEEYVSDCVILLDHRVVDQMATRRLRILKYRGSAHGTNEYPFLIEDTGFSVLPITSVGLLHAVSEERISTGVSRLDGMLGGEGIYRGSNVLISGTAGTGKSSLCCHFTRAAAARGERVLYFAFEESQLQIIRNMRSIGVDLAPYTESGLLRFHCARPTQHGLEMHLAMMFRMVQTFRPRLVLVDPVSNFMSIGTPLEIKAMLMRLVDYLKMHQITAVFTSLTSGSGHALEETEAGISSVIDTWLLLRDIEINGERNRGMYILKSRGMAHSNQIREFVLTSRGIELVDVYTGPEGVLTGSSRLAQEARAREEQLEREVEAERRRSVLERRKSAIEAQISALQADLQAESDEYERFLARAHARESRDEADRKRMAESRRQSDQDNRAAAE